MPPLVPYIPETITVHLGPPDSDAENVTVSFADYIANVASSEIYPTWPENAIRANIYAQISYALNRIYTEYYRSRGYNFDITNSTSVDQSFVYGRDIFENISAIVGEIFDDYIRRSGNVEPLFAVYCDGVRVQCNGLSQWGSVTLAEEGLVPYEILTNYYGDDIEIVRDAEILGLTASLPSEPLRVGDTSNDVRLVQIRLNRVGENYPSIPRIITPDGVFSYDTEAAVIAFQEIFGLTPDGIVGKATWYKLQAIYGAVKRLAELNSEGLSLSDVSDLSYPLPTLGDTGLTVRNIQYYLAYLAEFNPAIPPIAVDGIFGTATQNALFSFQKAYGLPETGTADAQTVNRLYDTYLGIIEGIAIDFREGQVIPFPGVILRIGAEAPDVRVLQEYLNYISQSYPDIPAVQVTGYFGTQTEAAVIAFQNRFGFTPNGIVDAPLWDAIASEYSDLYSRENLAEGQYPGYEIGT